ncbi:TPA: helix-turn-helix domain-containing protein [Klebsiella pneumoniae]|nr:helix-turn-helix domain-containing protein [Klebsiella pneumoniae]
MPLIEYIEKYYGGSQATFARAVGVKPPQVTQWIEKKFIVVDHNLYSPRRVLPAPK